MASSLKEAILQAEQVLQSVERKPKFKNTGSSKWRSIHQRLQELYVEECNKESSDPNVKTSTNLLDKLAKRDKLTCLVVNLFPGNQGFSFMLCGNSIDTETLKLPYDESDFLDYVDAEELPPLLVELLDKADTNIFYSGCVVTEIRDYRQSPNGQTYHSKHVLLRPTPQTLAYDINSITSNDPRWSMDDKLALESQLLLTTQEPLCLDPSVSVACLENIVQQEKHRLNTRPLKKCMKRYSQMARNRGAAFKCLPAPPGLRLHDFLAKKKERAPPPKVNLKVGKPCVDMWKQRDLDLSVPDNVPVSEYASHSDRPRERSNGGVIPVEEVILETERGNGRLQHVRVTIQQRQLDQTYQGEQYIDRNYNPNDPQHPRTNANFTKFYLGSLQNAQRYLKQLTESLSLETRQPVKISRVMAGQPPQLIQNPAYQSSQGSSRGANTQGGNTAPAGGGGDAGGGVSGTHPVSGPTAIVDAGNLQQNNNSNNQIGAGGDVPAIDSKQSLKLQLPLNTAAAAVNNSLSNQLTQSGLTGAGNSQGHVIQITGGQGQVQGQVAGGSSMSIPSTRLTGMGRQPPAYRANSNSNGCQQDQLASPVGTPTSISSTPPVSMFSTSVGAQLRQMRAPLSTPQQVQRPVTTSRPLPPILGRRPSGLDARQVVAAAQSANLPGSMGPPPTPPPSTTPSLQPSVTPPPAQGRTNTPSPLGTGPSSSSSNHQMAMTIAMALVNSQGGIPQSGNNIINTPIGVMTTLPSFSPQHTGGMILTTTTTSTSNNDVITVVSSGVSPSTTSQSSVIQAPANVLTGPINIISGAQGLLGTGGPAVIANAQGGVSIAQGGNQLTQAKLAQLMTMNLKNTNLRAAATAQIPGGAATAGAAAGGGGAAGGAGGAGGGTNQAQQLSLLQGQQQLLYNTALQQRQINPATLQQLQQQLQQMAAQNQQQQQQQQQQQLATSQGQATLQQLSALQKQQQQAQAAYQKQQLLRQQQQQQQQLQQLQQQQQQLLKGKTKKQRTTPTPPQ